MNKKETALQERLQKLVNARGGYLPNKSHGNMITRKGISDFRFTYKGLAVHWEIKTPEDATNVSDAQGIHCRLAQKAGGITAIISTIDQANYILDLIDIYCKWALGKPGFNQWAKDRNEVWDDGTKY